MLNVPEFEQYTFSVGVKFVRTFMVYDARGVIADFVMNECGAEGSPVPAGFYTEVGLAENAVELFDSDRSRRITATFDKIVYTQSTMTPKARIEKADVDAMLDRAQYLIMGILKFLRNPRMMFLGYVWGYVKTHNTGAERFSQPAARNLASRISALKFKESSEYISEFSTRVAYRKRLSEAAVLKDTNDYINAILSVEAPRVSGIWTQRSGKSEGDEGESPRAETITIDVQRMFDPHRALQSVAFKSHLDFCKNIIAPRLSSILSETL